MYGLFIAGYSGEANDMDGWMDGWGLLTTDWMLDTTAVVRVCLVCFCLSLSVSLSFSLYVCVELYDTYIHAE